MAKTVRAGFSCVAQRGQARGHGPRMADACTLDAEKLGFSVGLGARLAARERAWEHLLHSRPAGWDIVREEKKITGGWGAESGAGTRSVRTPNQLERFDTSGDVRTR